jgi:hypothetical protein
VILEITRKSFCTVAFQDAVSESWAWSDWDVASNAQNNRVPTKVGVNFLCMLELRFITGNQENQAHNAINPVVTI